MSYSGPNLDKFRIEKRDLSARNFEVFLCDLDLLRRCGGLEHNLQSSLVYHYPQSMPEKYRQSRFRQLTSTFETHQDLTINSRSGDWLNFFCFHYVKNHWFASRANQANQWPLVVETLFSSIPPSNSLVTVLDLGRAFWADTAPFKGLWLVRCFQNYRDTGILPGVMS